MSRVKNLSNPKVKTTWFSVTFQELKLTIHGALPKLIFCLLFILLTTAHNNPFKVRIIAFNNGLG